MTQGKSVVVTDGSTALGRAVAVVAAEHGAGVVANRLADDVVMTIKGNGGTVIVTDEDAATMSGAERLVQAAVDSLGGLNPLANTARPVRDVPLADMTEADWDTVVDGHLRPLYTCTRVATALMCDKGVGRIVNFAAEEGLRGTGGQANFVSAQAGIAAFTLPGHG